MKDAVAHTAGDPYHCGMRFLKERGWTEATDSYLVERFRAAGFVIVGKTNTPELASDFTTAPDAYGPTHNPWALDRSTGGSSGGSAAAVAAGMVALAHGNDMGGSIRVPSSMCGLVGLKPSRARTSLGPAFGEFWGMLTHEHVLTRSVRDTAAVLDCTAGARPGDPVHRTAAGAARGATRWAPTPAGSASGSGPASPSPTTTSIPTASPPWPPPPPLLERLGHDVAASGPAALDDDLEGALVPLLRRRHRAATSTGGRRRSGVTITEADVEPRNWGFYELGRTRHRAAVPGRHRADPGVAPPAGVVVGARGRLRPAAHAHVRDPAAAARCAGPRPTSRAAGSRMPFDFTGQPAISLPMHWNGDGLPIGVQLVAPPWREDLLLRVAAQLEAAQPWANRRPPISA